MKPLSTSPAEQGRLPYRACVGIMLINRAGLVWIGRRLPKWAVGGSGYVWQMPQGGISASEPPIVAARRELAEETSVTSVELIGEIPGWLTYDLPSELVGVALKGRYRGQRQHWFAMRFTGEDDEIDIGPKPGHKAEFHAWRWARIEELPGLVISFKRPIYERVVREFAPLVRTASETKD